MGPGGNTAKSVGGTPTAEARLAGAHVAAGHVLACAPIHAGVRLALIVVDVTVQTAPARIADARVSEDWTE